MSGRRTWRIGTRGSALARAQTRLVVDALRAHWSEFDVDVVVIRTQGDVRTDVPLSAIAGQGVFAVELEQALLRSEIDLAVHSAKDLRTTLVDGLDFVAFPLRADARDVLVSREGLAQTVSDLPIGARVGTSSPRRDAQLTALHPHVHVQPIRGNVDTRLRKLDDGEFDALLLAAAGLDRLGLAHRIAERIPVDVMIPAVGQGVIAIQARSDDAGAIRLCEPVDHLRTRQAITAERAFLARLGAGCTAPAGAHATIDAHGTLHLSAFLAISNIATSRSSLHGAADEAERIGVALAETMQDGAVLPFRAASTSASTPAPGSP